MSCTVTGILRNPGGTAVPGALMQFIPAPATHAGAAPVLRAPLRVTASTDAAGALTVLLVPGVYSVRVRQLSGVELAPFLIDVPEAETADLADILLHLPAPQSVYDAAASAAAAARAAGRATAAVDGALVLVSADATTVTLAIAAARVLSTDPAIAETPLGSVELPAITIGA